MPRTVMIYNNPTLRVATDEAGLATGLAAECQVTTARVQASPNYNTIPATGCAGATQSPGLTSYALALSWLQDWSAPGGGLSGFAFENDGQPVWFELVPDAAQATLTKITGEAFCAAGDYGGTFGDGSAADASTTWPCVSKPTPVVPPDTVTAAATDDDDELVPAGAAT
jgi:hypothetical protein